MSHTPGPWEMIGDDELAGSEPVYEIARGKIGPEFRSIAYVRAIDPDDGLGKEEIANASLIAAAPELLAALIDLVSLCESVLPKTEHDTDGELAEARAAIAKATSAAGSAS